MALWVDDRHPWLQVYTADDATATPRRALAVEPMTAPPDAFRSGERPGDAGARRRAGDEFSASWGIRALD